MSKATTPEDFLDKASIHFSVHEDDQHAWVEVSLAQIILLGLENSISPFSYVCERTNRVYLEKDFDANTLFEECRRRGIKYNINKSAQRSTRSAIRELPHFQSSAIGILKSKIEKGQALS